MPSDIWPDLLDLGHYVRGVGLVEGAGELVGPREGSPDELGRADSGGPERKKGNALLSRSMRLSTGVERKKFKIQKNVTILSMCALIFDEGREKILD